MKINFLPAFNGDCILITTDKFNILIDGGMSRTYYRILRDKLEELEQIDLVILTHIDEDHIAGLIELFDGKYDKSKEYATDDDDNDKKVSYFL